MSIVVNKTGIDVILELAAVYIDEILEGEKPPKIVFDSLHNYLMLQTPESYDNCRKIFLDNLHRDEPLRQIREIVEVPHFSPKHDHRNSDDENPRKKTRPWMPEEDKRLYSGILKYGVENWTLVSNFVGNGRNRAQCSQRYSRGLNPRLSKSTWTHEENLKLIGLVQRYGDKSWTRVAQQMGTRSDVQCRYHYAHLQKDLPMLFKDVHNHCFAGGNRTSPILLSSAGARRYNNRYSSPDLSMAIGLPLAREEYSSDESQSTISTFPSLQSPSLYQSSPLLHSSSYLRQDQEISTQSSDSMHIYPKRLIPPIANLSTVLRRISLPVAPTCVHESGLDCFLSNFN